MNTVNVQHYMSLSILKLVGAAAVTAFFILQNLPLSILLKDLSFHVWHALLDRPGSRFLVSAFELFSARLFARYSACYRPEVTIFFINSIAHFQHHDWKVGGRLDRSAAFVFRVVDRILSIVLPESGGNDRVLVLSGLGQKNVLSDSLYCYRQIAPERFLRRLGIEFKKVEQCMTNDGHVFFHNATSCKRAADFLRGGFIEGERAFYVELNPDDETRLFYQFAYWGKVHSDAKLKFGEFAIPFFSEFSIHARRTGAHSPNGDYFVRGATLPPTVSKSDILSFVWPRKCTG